MSTRSIVSLATSAVILVCCHAAPAATLLDQPPIQEFGIYSDEGCDALIFSSTFGHPQSIADNFVIDNSGAGFVIEEVVIWGTFEDYDGGPLPVGDDVDVLIHADNNGLPGSTLWAEYGVSASRVDTGLDLGSFPNERDEYMVTLTPASPIALADGTYWIEIYYNTGIGYDDWAWERTTSVPAAGILGVAFAPQTPGIAWGAVNSNTIPNVALRIDGTPGQVSCVDTAAELQTALTTAGANGVDDVIQVVQNTYLTPGSSFLYSTSENHDLQLLGGFTADCTERVLDPTNTVLDGSERTAVLQLSPAPGTYGTIRVEGFSVQHGSTSDTATAGLEIGSGLGFNGSITVAHNIIRDNSSANGSGGLDLRAGGGIMHLLNNLIVGNSSGTSRGAGLLECDGETIWAVNNTVADNACSGCLGGLEVAGTTGPYLSNNILWGNDGFDLSFNNMATFLMNNDIGSSSGLPDPGSSGNLSVDPLFEGVNDYRLRLASPLLDQGADAVPGDLPALDLRGAPRVQSKHVDMGAYEFQVLFFSLFEDPSLEDWSVAETGLFNR